MLPGFRLIDLSVPLEHRALSEPLPAQIRYARHGGEGLQQMQHFPRVTPQHRMRLLNGIAIGLGVIVCCQGARGADKPPPIRTDLYGDPLPAGAVARMGTIRFRNGGSESFEISPDGKTILLYSSYSQPILAACDARTGRVLYTLKGEWAAGSPDGRDHQGGGIRNFGFSPDNRFLAVLQDDHIRLVDKETGKRVRTLAGQIAEVQEGRFSRDARSFALRCRDGTVRIWATATGRLLRKLPLPAPDSYYEEGLSPDLTFLAYPQEGTVQLWNLTTGRLKKTLPLQTDRINWLVFSPKSETLVATDGERKKLYLHEVGTGNALRIVAGVDTDNMVFSPDGRMLAAVSRKDGDPDTVSLWELPGGKYLTRFEAGPGFERSFDGIGSLTFSPSGKQLAILGNGRVGLYDLATKTRIQDWHVSVHSHGAIQFTAEGTVLAAHDGPGIRFWDVVTGGEVRRPVGHTDEVRCLAFSADGNTLASGGFDGTVRVWDAQTGRQLRKLGRHDGGVSDLVVSLDGKTLASLAGPDDTKIKIWDTVLGRRQSEFDGPPVHVFFNIRSRTVLDLSPDGKLLAVASNHGQPIECYDTKTGKKQREFTGWAAVWALAFSQDGSMLAVNGALAANDQEHAIFLLDAATGKIRHKLEGWASHFVFSPDGKRLGAYGDTGILIWELATLRRVVNVPFGERIRHMGIASDGRVLVLNQIYDSPAGYSVGEIGARGHRLPVPKNDRQLSAHAFSMDGRKLATASDTGQILVWDLESLLGK